MGVGRAVGGRGTNQYQVRGYARTPAPMPTVGLYTTPPEVGRRRCGEVWGTRCGAWVVGPDWSHGRHPSLQSKEAVAKSPSALPDVLTRLAADEDGDVRQGVAENPSAPPEVLAGLAMDKNRWVRGRVADNHSTPPEALVRLAEDENEDVHYSVAGNPSTPAEVLVRLAEDETPRVRYQVAENPNTPAEALFGLALDDADREVREVACNNPNLPEHMRAMVALGDDSRG